MPSLGGLPEVPCAKCGERVAGLPWGELCPECRAERSGVHPGWPIASPSRRRR